MPHNPTAIVKSVDYEDWASIGDFAITNVSGTISDGQTITISGAQFGSRSNTPLYYDDYRNATLGNTAVQAGLETLGTDGKGLPVVANDQSLSGGKSLKMDYATGQSGEMFPRVGKTGYTEDKLFVSSWCRYTLHTVGLTDTPILKRVRIAASDVNPYSGDPHLFETIRPSHSTGLVADVDRGVTNSDNSFVFRDEQLITTPNANEWSRTDHYMVLNTPGVSDGLYQLWCKNVLNDNIQNAMFRLAGYTQQIQSVISDFDGNSSYGDDNGWYMWVDQMYIDNTLARVELGNAPIYADCTKNYTQPSVIWSEGSVQVSLRPCDLTGLNYLFVINEAGTATAGYGVTI